VNVSTGLWADMDEVLKEIRSLERTPGSLEREVRLIRLRLEYAELYNHHCTMFSRRYREHRDRVGRGKIR
jgi:hypothetical protein